MLESLNQFFDEEFRAEVATAGGDYLLIDTLPGPANGTLVDLIAQPNTWYHLAVVGDSSAGTLTMFVDYTAVAQATGFDGLYENTGTWLVGASSINDGQIVDALNDGWIDEVRISNVALSPTEFLRAVPEPGTLSLLAVLSLGMLSVRRRAVCG